MDRTARSALVVLSKGIASETSRVSCKWGAISVESSAKGEKQLTRRHKEKGSNKLKSGTTLNRATVRPGNYRDRPVAEWGVLSALIRPPLEHRVFVWVRRAPTPLSGG